MTIRRAHLLLAARLLHLAADQFGTHGCNDFPEFAELVPDLEERRRIVREYHEWNGDPQEYDPDWLLLGDDTLMGYLSALFAEEAKKGAP